MKKILKIEIVAEIEVDTDWYDPVEDWDGITARENIKDIEKHILKVEKQNYPEWILDGHIVSDKLTIRDK